MNLKQIFVIDTNNEKLDKVNYNFDQIIANGAGPIGAQGAKGSQGFTGLTGAQGPQGAQGSQGSQGPSGIDGDTSWKTNIGANNVTLVPIHDNDHVNPPSIIIGIDKSDPRYNDVLQDATLQIHKSIAFNDNLYLTDDSSGLNKVSFKLFKFGTKVTFSEGFFSGGGIVRYIASKFVYKSNNVEFANLSATQFNVKVPSLFEGNSEFKGNNLKINVGSPAVDKILTASDNQGTVAWKDISEIRAGVPVGTIVPILSSVFNSSDNFDKGFNLPNSTSPIDVYFGRGKNDYRGWYLCHGENWIKPNTANTYAVPDLSSFTYHIDANPSGAGQGTANKTDNLQTIVGGSDMTMTATFASGQYSISSSFDTSNVTMYNPSSSGTQLEMQRFIYVVFLGEDDLYWQDNGTIAGNNTDLVFENVTFNYASNSVITPAQSLAPSNLGSSLSENQVSRTLVIPGNNPSYNDWLSIKMAYLASGSQSELDNAWKNASLQYFTGNAGEDALLYVNLATGEKAVQGAWIKNNYFRFIKSSDGKIFDNGTGFEEGNDAMSILEVANELSTGGTSGNTLVDTDFILNSSVIAPAWKGATSYVYQWQISTDNLSWSDIEGAISASLTTSQSGTGTVYYRVTAKINEPGINGIGKAFYATTPVSMIVGGNEIVSSRTHISCDDSSAITGYIKVNVVPVTIKYATRGGFSSIDCYCNSNLVISGIGNYSAIVDQYQTNEQFIEITSVGNYNFELSAYGPPCYTCGNWDARIQIEP